MTTHQKCATGTSAAAASARRLGKKRILANGSQVASPKRSPARRVAATHESHSQSSNREFAALSTRKARDRSAAKDKAPKASRASAARTRMRNHSAGAIGPLEALVGVESVTMSAPPREA